MDVTDADLLALAGDDSSDEESTPAPMTAANIVLPMPPASKSLIHPKDTSATMSNSTPSTSGKLVGGKRVKKTQKDDSEEEGEAYVIVGGVEYLIQC